MPIAFEQLPPIGSPSGSAGGDLTGTYPNPTIGAKKVTAAKIADATITTAQLADPGTGKVIGSNGAGNAADVLPPGYEWGYAEKTTDTSITATTAATANQVAVTGTISSDGAPVLIELFAAQSLKGTGEIIGVIYMDGAVLQDKAYRQAANGMPINVCFRTTPAAGNHTFGFNAYVDGGTGGVNATGLAPAFIRVTKV